MKLSCCSNCKFVGEGRLNKGDEVSSVYCKKNKKEITSHHLVEKKPDWCPLEE